MTGWRVFAADGFLVTSLALLLIAPIVGVSRFPFRIAGAILSLFTLVSIVVLGVAWRETGAVSAAIKGPLALAVGIVLFWLLGRVAQRFVRDRLAAGLVAAAVGVLLTLGVFVAAPLTANWPVGVGQSALLLNPLVTTATAAEIDVLHVEAIYRTSPLAHRGAAPPSWAAGCFVYVILGLAAVGGSRIRPRSQSL